MYMCVYLCLTIQFIYIYIYLYMCACVYLPDCWQDINWLEHPIAVTS